VQKHLNRSWCRKKSLIRWGSQSPHEKWQFWGKGPIMKYRDFLSWAVQKRLNWSICHLGCGFGWAQTSTSSIVFARWRQCAHMGGHTSATWRTQFNSPSAPAMWSYVELFWPLVMVALCNRADHYIFAVVSSFFLLSFFSSPNLRGRRLDVYYTSSHGVALV